MTRAIIALKQSYIAPHPVPYTTKKKFCGGLCWWPIATEILSNSKYSLSFIL
jgi:hypothetical protein